MDKELERIAREYVEKAEQTFEFILKLLNVKDKYGIAQLVREKNDTTFLINGKNYVIGTHGRGCFFSDGSTEIDWSFGDTRICGIDCWHLHQYIVFYYSSLVSDLSYEKIKQDFEVALKEDLVDKRNDLYYFKD